MKKIGVCVFICSFLMMLLLATANASTTHQPKTRRLALTIDLVYQQRNENGDYDQYQIQNIIKTTSNDRQWITVPDKILHVNAELIKEDPLILLSRITNADNNRIALNFVIINTAGAQPKIVSSPKMVVSFGQTGLITLNDVNQKLRLTVIATTK